MALALTLLVLVFAESVDDVELVDDESVVAFCGSNCCTAAKSVCAADRLPACKSCPNCCMLCWNCCLRVAVCCDPRLESALNAVLRIPATDISVPLDSIPDPGENIGPVQGSYAGTDS